MASEYIEYTGPDGVTVECEVVEEKATGTTLRDVVTGEEHHGLRLLLEPLDGSPRFWSVTMRRVAP